jgi:butyrate kinase
MKEEALRILVINPGSTSTKIALFKDEHPELEANLEHPIDEIKKFESVWDQFEYRKNAILAFLGENEIPMESLSAVVGRGGLLRSVEGGTYEVNEKMLADAGANLQGIHISNLGCALAHDIAAHAHIEAYMVDPVSTDEFIDLAYFSGLKEIVRKSLVHTLSIHGVVRRVCRDSGWDHERRNFVVAHLGGGISVCPVEGGRILDGNNANSGGPFSPQRTGRLPTQELIDLCFSGKYTKEDLVRMTLKEGGLTSYLGTDDAREIEKRIGEGDEYCRRVYEAMAYQIAKEIGLMATVLKGDIDAIILTGGLAKSNMLTDWIRERVEFIAPILVICDVSEMQALASGTLRVLRGREKAKIY